MIKSNFREWTLDKIDEILGLRQVKQLAALTDLLAYKYKPNDFEKQYLIQLQAGVVCFGRR
jgi:hypothetical protein